MGGGGVRSKETGQPAGRTRGTKCDAAMRGAGRWEAAARGEASRQPAGREAWVGRDECPESSVDTADGSLMASAVMDGATAPQRRGTACRLLDFNGRGDGSLAVRDGARWLLDGEGRRERGGDGPRAQRRWAAMDSAMAN